MKNNKQSLTRLKSHSIFSNIAIVTSILSIVLAVAGAVIVSLNIQSYTAMRFAVIFVSLVMFVSVLSFLTGAIGFLRALISKKICFKYSFIVMCLAFIVMFITKNNYYPWARGVIHDPSPSSIHWREMALGYLAQELRSYEERYGQLPDAKHWQERLKRNDFDYINKLIHWQQFYNSDIAFNENLAGKKLKNIDGECVLLFEVYGKNTYYGSQELFVQNPATDDYRFIVLVNGDAGRYRISDGFRESIWSDFEGSDQLKWQP